MPDKENHKIITLIKCCRWCQKMKDAGEDKGMHCELGLSKGDSTALTCKFFVYFLGVSQHLAEENK